MTPSSPIPLVLVAVLVLVGAWWYSRQRAPTTDDGDVCLVCGAIELIALAPGAYECSVCGYAGGPGWAAYRDAQRLREFARLDPRGRLAAIRVELQSVHDLLFVAVGELSFAGTFWPKLALRIVEETLDTDLLVDTDLPEAARLTLAAIERVGAAKRAIADVRLLIESGPVPTRAPIVLREVHWCDDPLARVHVRAGAALVAARAMFDTVDEQCRRHFAIACVDGA